MASYPYLVDLDLNGHRIIGAALEVLPANPDMMAGRFYYNSSKNRFCWCNGSEWLYFTEVGSVTPGQDEYSLIDDTTNNVITLKVLKGGEYITISNDEPGIINLTLEYNKLYQYYRSLTIRAHFITYEDMADPVINLEVGECIYCTTQDYSGIYQYTGSGVGVNRFMRLSDQHGVFIKQGQITEDNLDPEYKEDLQEKFDDVQAQIDNQIFTMGFSPEDGSVWVELGEHNSQIEDGDINPTTGEIEVYFNFE